MSRKAIAITKLENPPKHAKECPFFSMGYCGACGDGFNTVCKGASLTTNSECRLRVWEAVGVLNTIYPVDTWRTDNPTIEGNYLVTMRYGKESPTVVTIARWVDNLRWFDWTTFEDERQGWVYPRGFEWVEAKYVIGWQPLPLPMEVGE